MRGVIGSPCEGTRLAVLWCAVFTVGGVLLVLAMLFATAYSVCTSSGGMRSSGASGGGRMRLASASGASGTGASGTGTCGCDR